MDKKKKIDDLVIKTLDLKVIRRLVCQTDKGPLELVIRKGESNYFMSLDATPCDKEINDKLMDILFKPEVPTIKKVEYPKFIPENGPILKKKYKYTPKKK